VNLAVDLVDRTVVVAEQDGIDERTFLAKAEEAKLGCPISRLLAAAAITLQAKLV